MMIPAECNAAASVRLKGLQDVGQDAGNIGNIDRRDEA